MNPTPRRAKGLGTIIERSDGRYEARIRKDGKSYSEYAKTQVDAEEKLVFLRARVLGQDAPTAPRHVTVAEFLKEFVAHRSHGLSVKTIEGYKYYASKVDATLGSMRLRQVGVKDLRRFFRDLNDTQLCLSTERRVFQILKGMFGDAHEQEYITKNPMEHIKGPSGSRDSPAQVWSANEVNKFLQTAKDQRLYAAFYTLLVVGLRIGELSALTWDDLKSNKLAITKTAAYIKGKLEISSPKTPNSKRTIILPPDVVAVLKAHRERQEEEFDVSGRQVQGNLMFPSTVGKVLRLCSFTKTFGHIMQKAGVTRIRVHDMRHTCATLSLKRGVPAEVLAERLGHDVATLLGIYSHIDDERREEGTLSLEQLTAPSRGRSGHRSASGISDALRCVLNSELDLKHHNMTSPGLDELVDKLTEAVFGTLGTLLR